MKIATEKFLVIRDPMTAVNKEVWAWEAPLLEEKFTGSIEKLTDGFIERNGLPDVTMEYDKLGRVYGADGETGVPLVQLVYGRGREGVDRLGQAIQKAAGAKPARKAKPAKKKAIVTDEVDFDVGPPDGEPDDPLG